MGYATRCVSIAPQGVRALECLVRASCYTVRQPWAMRGACLGVLNMLLDEGLVLGVDLLLELFDLVRLRLRARVRAGARVKG